MISVILKMIVLLLAISILLFYVGVRVQLNKEYSASIQARTGADFAGFNQALTTYKQSNGQLPSANQGLDALIHKPSDAETSWRRLFDFVPKDFWGHPYRYRLAPEKPRGYDVFSLGPDGVENTKDDIHLK